MRTTLNICVAACATFVVVWCLANIASRVTGVPRNFPPFTALPLLSGVAAGFLGGSAVYALVRAFASSPNRTFFFVSIAVLALSLALPLRLSFTKSRRFAGVTPAAQMTLVLLHAVVATFVVGTFTRIGNTK